MRRWSLVLMVGLLCLGLAGACSGGDELDLDDFAPVEETTSSSSTSTSTTVATTSTSSTSTVADDPEAAVLDTWVRLLHAARTGAPDEEQLATIESLAGEATVEQLVSPLFPEFDGREIESFAALTGQDDGSYAIDECLVMNRGITADKSIWLLGTAEPVLESPTGWQVTDIKVVNLDPCVPRSIAEAAIAGYEAFLDAEEDFYDPPNPDSPLIEETTTGGLTEFVIELIDDLSSKGQVVRGRAGSMPEFWAINSVEELVIVDCQDVDPDYGIYVASTGERTDRIAPIGEGELDLIEATMQLEGGTWKVSQILVEGDVQCRTPPTPVTLQVSGG